MRYKNPDPMEKRLAGELVDEIWDSCNKIFEHYVKKRMHINLKSVLARELDSDACEGLSKKCNARQAAISFDHIGITDDSSKTPTEYDKFWNLDANQNSDSDFESVKKDNDEEKR
jgi:hypothetical protein